MSVPTAYLREMNAARTRAMNLITVSFPHRPVQETAIGAGRAAAIIAGDRVWYKNDEDYHHCFLVEPEQEVGTDYFYRKEKM
uniref:Uncharacterized protein n=1 Tax=Amphimedon queenslandica TaxID=400682 RepID=A0A1X7SRW0_AMPQE